MKSEKKSVLTGKLIGNIISLILVYYLVSKITNSFLPKNTHSSISIILNTLITILYTTINSIGTELIKIRKILGAKVKK